jgi:hypothetical protein
VRLARSLARPAGDHRLVRLARAFSLVSGSVAAVGRGAAEAGTAADAATMVLAALLASRGEHVRLEFAGERPFVLVQVAESDVARLPPHACPLRTSGRLLLPLWPGPGSPFGFLPLGMRRSLGRLAPRPGRLTAPAVPS